MSKTDTKPVDVLVVGLGPAGASAAAAAVSSGSTVLGLDRRIEPGIPVQCAEFVPAMLKNATYAVRASYRQSISSMLTQVESDQPDLKENFPGTMIDRAVFDRHLVRRAIEAGAECRFATTVTEVSPDGTVVTNDERIAPKLIIGADGPRSVVGRAIGQINTELVMARQITVHLTATHSATDVFLSRRYRGGYAWLFPKGAVANLGVGVEFAKMHELKGLLHDLHRELVRKHRVGSRVLSQTGGAIPVGGMLNPCGQLESRPVLLAGDAAGLTNPVTGAGISAAVMSGRLAGEAAAAWVAGRGDALVEYQEELEALFKNALDRAVERRRKIMRKSTPTRDDLRSAWIAYPQYWAA